VEKLLRKEQLPHFKKKSAAGGTSSAPNELKNSPKKTLEDFDELDLPPLPANPSRDATMIDINGGVSLIAVNEMAAAIAMRSLSASAPEKEESNHPTSNQQVDAIGAAAQLLLPRTEARSPSPVPEEVHLTPVEEKIKSAMMIYQGQWQVFA